MEPITERSSQSGIAPPASPWAVFPRDLIGEISGHLPDAADFVRFHAVCRPWRAAAPSLLSPASTYPRLRPWLLAFSNDLFLHLPINYGCSSLSRKTSSYYRHGYDGVVLPGASSTSSTNLVACADGTAAWLFTVRSEPTLVDLLTGAVTPLPRIPMDDKSNQWTEKSRGIVYGDGTVLMYNIVLDKHDFGYTSTFTAAIRRAGDAAWKLVKKTLPWTASSRLSVVYHDRKILACEGVQFGLLLDLDLGSNGPPDVGSCWINWRSDGDSRVNTRYNQDNYVFELHGELMRATVLVEKKYWRRGCSGDDPTWALSVMVHAIEGVDGDGKMRWVVRDGQSLIDHVFFLGSPASFAADAARLGVDGRCVYFVFRNRVFKYNLIDRECQLMERLRPWWGSDMVHIFGSSPVLPLLRSTKFKKRSRIQTRSMKNYQLSNSERYVEEFVIY